MANTKQQAKRAKKAMTKGGQSLQTKMAGTGVKVKHVKATSVKANDMGKNRNGAFTSNGSLNQGYVKGEGFTKTTSSSARGRMAEAGSTRAGGLTHSFTQKDDDGNTIRQSGRGGLATRRQRYYDVRKGLGLAGG